MNKNILNGIITFALCILLNPHVSAQNGTPYITHFKESKEIETQNWSISQDGQNVMLFANKRGLMSFDGSNWEIIRLPFVPFVVKQIPKLEKVFVGGNNNYGYIGKDELGNYLYHSVSGDSLNLGIISKILTTDSTIFFYGDRTISRHNLEDFSQMYRWIAGDSESFTGLFVNQKNTFINLYNKGLHRLESDTLFPLVTGFYTEKDEILFCLPYDSKRVLLGMENNKLYTFDGIKFYDYVVADDGYLEASILADGLVLSDSLYAFSTLDGGVEVVGRKSQKDIYTINYQNGLPDDEIYAMALDNNNGLWLSHEYGISRVDFKIPLRNFSNYPGLKGNLIASLWHKGELYVATSEGVYYLTEVKDYSDVEVLVKVKPKKDVVLSNTVSNVKSNQTEIDSEKKSSKNFFTRLFKKKSDETQDLGQEIVSETIEQKKEDTKPAKPTYVRKTVSKIKSINYIFKKVDGIDEKCKQLLAFEKGILVATNSGLYEVVNHKSKIVVKDKYINQIRSLGKADNLFVTTNSGVFSLKYEKGKWITEQNLVDFREPVYTTIMPDDQNVWLGGNDVIYKFSINSNSQPEEFLKYAVATDFPEQYYLHLVNDTIFLFLESGLFYFQQDIDSFKVYNNEINNSDSKFQFIISPQNNTWIKVNNEWQCMDFKSEQIINAQKILHIFKNVSSIHTDDHDNLWVINDNNQLYKISETSGNHLENNFGVYIQGVQNNKGEKFEFDNLVFKPENNSISFNLRAPSFQKENSAQFQYTVEGLMDGWSNWSNSSSFNLILRSGDYTFKARAKDIWGNVSNETSIDFTIKKPFTQTFLFYLLIAIAIVIGVYFIIKFREQQLQKEKKILEEKVVERTKEVVKQKEEIAEQRDEIVKQKEEITDSIHYASRIQRAMLPMLEHFDASFKEYFILFKPRDIVSGDFYWISELQDKVYFTAADCTGHGVPGAFMSMLGISSLNEIVASFKDLTASKVLTLLREKIKFSLHQTGKDGENKDGMDMAMCVYHKSKSSLEFAGAYNPLFLYRDNELIEYKADRMPIGIYVKEKEEFTNHEIKIKKGDVIYIFSDGYPDQFGGVDGGKFKIKNLKIFLNEIVNKPMEEQKELLNDNFENWKKGFEQTDDVIMIGIRF